MSDNPYESPNTAGTAPQRKERRLATRLVEVLVVVCIIGVLVALFLLPAVRSSSSSARRSECNNNLKQIALALQNYEANYQSLPPAYTVDPDGQPLHSWRTLILPYLEQEALYKTIDLSKSWNDPANQQAFETNLSVFQCPAVNCPPNHTTYLAVVGPNACFSMSAARKLSEITDDHDLTLMVIEVDADHHIPWMKPADVEEEWILNLEAVTEPPHFGGVQAVTVNAHTRFINLQSNPRKLRALITIDGNDDALARQVDKE